MGYCVKCGQWVEDSAKFCQSCGEPNMNYYQGFNSVSPVSAEPVQEGVPAAKHGLNVMAIVAMGLCELGIPGLILAIIALKRAKSGEYRVSLKPLAIAALITSICFIVFWIAYFVFFGFIMGKIVIHGIDFDYYLQEITPLVSLIK